MSPKTMLRFVVSLPAIAAALLGQAGCNRASEPKMAAPAAPAWKLDESKFVAPIRFGAADLDPAKGACTDFAGYANAKWLAANPIPATVVVGRFDVLELRSLGIQGSLRSGGRRAAPPASRIPLPTSGPRAWTRRASTLRVSRP